MRRVVDQLGGFDDIAGNAVNAAEVVNQADLFGFFASIDAAAENVGVLFVFQPCAAAEFDGFDEFLVDIAQHAFPNLGLRRCFRRERVAHAFVAAGGSQTAFDTGFVHQAGKVKTAADHADAADNAGRVGVNFVGCGGNVVAAGSAHVFGNEVNRDVFVFGFEAADFVKGRVGHDRRTAGAVGTDDDGFGVAVFVGGFHAVAQDLDLVVDVVADFAGQVDNGSVFAAGLDRCGFSFFFRKAENQAEEDEDGDAAPDVAPNAGAALFLVGGEEDFAQGVALPVVNGGGG